MELRAGAERPDLARSMFDSHLCVAEFLLYGPTPYAEVLALAATLRESARRSGVLRAVAFATALRGEAALLSGDLVLAEAELTEAAQLHHDIGSTAGEAHSLQRLAEVRLAHGDRAEATRLLHRALPLARWSAIALHLLQRVYGTMIRAAPDVESARAVVDQATAALGQEDSCTFCNDHARCARRGSLRRRRRPRRRPPAPRRRRAVRRAVERHRMAGGDRRSPGPPTPGRRRPRRRATLRCSRPPSSSPPPASRSTPTAVWPDDARSQLRTVDYPAPLALR